MDEKFAQSQQANELLNSPAFNRTCDGARERFVKMWENELDPAKRENLWHMLKALEQVKVALVSQASAAIQEETNAKANWSR